MLVLVLVVVSASVHAVCSSQFGIGPGAVNMVQPLVWAEFFLFKNERCLFSDLTTILLRKMFLQ